MKNKLTKVLLLLVVIAALVATMALPAAAVAVTGVSGVEVTVDSNGSISESGGTVTATVKGSYTTRKTTTITVTNTSGSTATISFNYSVSTHDSSVSTIDDLAGADSGSYSVLLTAGATKTFTMCSKRFTTSTTATATLENFKVEVAAAESNVTVTYGSLGSVKIDGTAVASGSVNAVSSATGGSFVAVPSSGSKFVAWINPANNAVVSTSATYQLIPTEDTAIKAVFTNASSAPMFYADDTAKLFEGLDAAISYASSASNKVITLASDATLAAGNYTIPAGITLNIPFNAAGTVCGKEPTIHDNTYTQPSVFRTLNMASGANLTVNGTLSLSAQVSSKYGNNGAPSGPLPFIKMAANSKITVENGGNLYAWGFITGSGSVEAKRGATVYECFQIADYRGGDATTQIVSKDDEYGVFPFNQYYIQNIEVPLTIHAGATEKGFTALSVTLAGTQKSDVPFIGSDNSMFVLDSGYVVKDYVEGTGRMDVKIYGNVSVSTMSMSMKVSLIGNLTIDSSKYALPIAQHLTLYVESGEISMDQSVAFLPGSELYIREGAVCRLGEGKKIIIYDLDQWLYNDGANGYSGTTNQPYIKAKYVPGGDGIVGRLKDALVQVDGTINASAGAAYVTDGGANVYSTGTGKITLTPGTETVSYQVITNDTNVGSWPEIALKPIVLTNADGSIISADVAGEYDYYVSTGKWDKPGHLYEAVVTAPTCTEKGYTTHTCVACLTSYTDTEVAALGHTEVIDEGKAPTCTATGLTEGSHCSVCNEIIVGQAVLETLEHTVVTDEAVDATCTTAGKKEGKHCSVCGEVLVAQEEIPALGHTELVDEAVAPTCTATGLTEGSHCSACNEVLVAQEEVPALGHTEVIDEAKAATCTENGLTEGKHCSVCGAVLAAQEEVPALGHTEVVDEAKAATCTATGLTEGKHCTTCGEVTVAQTEVPALGHTEVIDEAKAATCTEAGKTEGKHCTVCGEVTVAQEEVPAQGHSYEKVVTAPDCNNGGYTTYTCSVCGDNYTSDHVDPAGHDTVVDEAVAPTCTETGLTKGSHCATCGATLIAQEEVPALGHTEVIDEAKAPTCTETGKTEGKHCDRCGEVTVAQEEVPALGHNEVIDEAKAPTCTETGKTEGKHCSVCSEVLTAQEEVPALGHSHGDWEVTKNPTYTETGSQSKTCSVCGDVVTEEIPVLANPVNSWNICLGDDIGVNFNLNVLDTDVVTVTVNGESVEFTLVEGVVTVHLAAAQMTDEIVITINGMTVTNTYTVRGYAETILNSNETEQTKALVRAMLVYGGAAQKYFNYNVTNLASEGFENNAVVSTEVNNIVSKDDIDGLSFYGASLIYRNKNAVRFYFAGNTIGMTFTANGENVTTGTKNEMTYIEVANINPQNLGDAIEVVVTAEDGKTLTVAYSPLNYIVRMYTKAGSSEETKLLAQALYGYYQAALAYMN